uniref:serine--tRNA ligase n=1 Tax=Aegilops tauschii TaxID=37682 RepID=M8BPS6_AEGTA
MKEKLDPSLRQALVDEGKNLKESLIALEEDLVQLTYKLQLEAQSIPNTTHPDVPVGDEESSVTRKEVGSQRSFSFPIKDHLQLGKDLDLFDFDAASELKQDYQLELKVKKKNMGCQTLSNNKYMFMINSSYVSVKQPRIWTSRRWQWRLDGRVGGGESKGEVSGSKFYYLKNEAVLLEMALVNWGIAEVSKKGFTPLITPEIVRSSVVERCGFQPRAQNTQDKRAKVVRMKWWKLKAEATHAFKEKAIKEKTIKEKKDCFKRLHLDKSADNIEKYKVAKKTAKRDVSEARGQAYEDLYQRLCLNTKEGKRDIYKMAKIQERKTRDVNQVKCIKDGADRLLEDGDIDEDVYSIDNSDQCLIGTAEIPVGGIHMNSILVDSDLPLKYVAYSHCFRTEAGAAGAATRGLYRVHQFSKVEMFIFCRPEESDKYHEELITIEENLYASLGLHFKYFLIFLTLDMATGDLGAPAYRKYDIEAWMPGLDRYGEISSASNCTDYQSRRLGIRFRPAPLEPPPSTNSKKGKGGSSGPTQFVHTLNATAVAVPRLIISILENFQQEDGMVVIPEPLRPFMGGLGVLTPKTK